MTAMGPMVHLLYSLPCDSCNADPNALKVALDTGGLSRKSFPKGFVFGTATSAYQVEGMTDKDGRGPCIWDVFVKIPGRNRPFVSRCP